MLKILRVGLMAATVLVPAQVMAQSTGGQAASADNGGTRIIVTARKREEDIQTVPTTVAVATAETIDRLGLDNLQDIGKTTPGLIFDDSFGRDGNRPVIRGQANILGQSGVAFFIDGIYYTGSLADYDVDTIERIEVVKGPQSALYGRNTYSGAINIISKMPGDVWEGRVQADIGEHDRYELTAGIRGPISDGLSVGVNGRWYDFGGEFTNQFDGNKVGDQSSWSVSGMLNWDNGGPFTATARVYYNRTDDGQQAIFATDASDNNCFFDNGGFYGGDGRYFCGVIEPRMINTDYTRQFGANDPGDVGLEADTYNASLRMEYELSDELTLVSLTGYNSRKQTLLTDGDYSPGSFQPTFFATFPAGGGSGLGIVNGGPADFSFASRDEVSDWSQEIRLQYLSDDFDFILGGYYFDQSDDSFSIRDLPANAAQSAQDQYAALQSSLCSPAMGCFFSFFTSPGAIPATNDDIDVSRNENLTDINNMALFGAVEWHITPTINLGLEGRYSEEEIEIQAFGFDLGDPRPMPTLGQAVFKSFTPRATFNWQATPDNLFYAIYSEGLKPGGFNGALAIEASEDPTIDVATFDEEENQSFEVGFKNVFADGDIIFNIAGYYTEIEGYQLTQNVSVPPNQISVTVNAGDAVIRGLEMDTVIRLNEAFTLTANYALADTEFTSGFDQNQGVLNDVLDDGLVNCSLGDQFPGGDDCDDSAFGSIDGKRIPRAPVHRIFADLDFRTPLSGDWDIFAGANVTYTSTSFAQVHNLAETGDSTVTDVRLGVSNDRYRVQFYVKNLFDEDSIQQIIRYADGNASFRRNFIAGLRPGRRIGVIVSAGI